MRIDKNYVNRGDKGGISSEPLSNQASPIYEIILSNNNNNEDNDPNQKESDDYWNGGLRFQESSILTTFDSIVNRFKKMYKDSLVIWHISSSEFRIRIVLKQIETEIGFDISDFSKRVDRWSNSFTNYNRNNLEHKHMIECLNNYGTNRSIKRTTILGEILSSKDSDFWDVETLAMIACDQCDYISLEFPNKVVTLHEVIDEIQRKNREETIDKILDK